MSLSAITNGNTYLATEITDEFGKTNKWECHGCKGEMIFHRDIAGVKVQHFVHKTNCPFETEPETQEHIKMKQWFYDNVIADEKYKPDSIFIGDQKPDVFIKYKGKEIAIECQCSKISYEKWLERTQKYTTKGIYVFWIFGKKWYQPEFNFPNKPKKRINEIEKKLHWVNFGRVYYFDLNKTCPNILPIHFEPITIIKDLCDECWREENLDNWDGDCDGCWVYDNNLEGERKRTLKSTKQLNIGQQDVGHITFLPIENQGLKVARLYDKKWWGESK